MASSRAYFASIDEYIVGFPPEIRLILQQIRETIRAAAPEAAETISYQMPTFAQQGILVHFAAFKQHIGLYPPVSGDEQIEREAAAFAGPKGNLKFPLDRPIPYDLIGRIVKLRVEQNVARAALKAVEKKRSGA